jgi:hypothetical protein
MDTVEVGALTVNAGDTGTADAWNLDTKKVATRGERTTGSSTTTSTVGVLRLDDIPLAAGRVYKICTSALNLDTSVDADVVRAEMRYTTDGSTPTTASTAMMLGAMKLAAAAAAQPVVLQRTYSPASAETLSLLMCVNRVSGTGSVSILGDPTFPIQMWVEDGGLDPGDVATEI